jgi:hypothetical protein
MATGFIRQGNQRDLFFSSMAVGTQLLSGRVFKVPLPNLLVHIYGAVFSYWILC